MLDLPGVVVFAADHHVTAAFQRVGLVVAWRNRRPAHRDRVLEQDVGRVAILPDRVHFGASHAVPAEQVKAHAGHQRRLRLALFQSRASVAEPHPAASKPPAEK
jgi:hypothetical protein